MTINRNNFEEYLLDYLDGNLNPLHSAELMAFLAENPEYEKYFPGRILNTLSPGSEQFPGKEALKKKLSDVTEINETNFDEFCIAESEELLDPEDIERLNQFIGKDIQRIKNLELFNSLKLYPDLSIQYPDKYKILKHERGLFRKRYFYYGLAIAASVAVLMILTLNRPSADSTAGHSDIALNPSTARDQTGDPDPIVEPDAPKPSAVEMTKRKKPARSEERLSETALTDDPKPVIASAPADLSSLNMLKPVTRELKSPANLTALKFTEIESMEQFAQEEPKRQPLIDSDNLITEIFSKINLWKTAENAISGFNYLTEAQLSINKTTDEQGKLTGLSLNTESYTIAGKLK